MICNDRAIKMIFFDMEGTLFSRNVKLPSGGFSKTIWTAIAEVLGEDALKEEEETINKWKRQEYKGYLEWMEDTIKIHLKYGLKKDTFESLVKSVEFYKGVKESFKIFKMKDIKTAILTGGFKQMADRAQKELNIEYAISSCEYFWNSNGRLSTWNLVPCYENGKASFLSLLMDDMKLKRSECAFIGDAKDDIWPAREVGTSIAFNGPSELQEVCSFVINHPEGNEDFQDVLQYLFS
ncbi:hypothetical protein ES705_20646 [subsurface metagenome]